MMVGVGFFGFLLGNIATLLFRMDAERERHLTKVDRAEAFMRYHQIPKGLREKVGAYYHYLWESRHHYDDRTVLATLPPTLRAEIILTLHAALIDRVPFFKGAERRSVEEIILALKPRVALPGEILFRAGDPPDALYIIQHGAIEILTADRRSDRHAASRRFFRGDGAAGPSAAQRHGPGHRLLRLVPARSG
ncbi:MAG: cyclic nucleotide-binding domain-containing protein [Candidatus Competibacter sp.]